MKKIFVAMLLLLTSGVAFAQNDGRIKAKGLVTKQGENFRTYQFTRHAVGDKDIQIEILYAGICHSDFMIKRQNECVVPGHEIVGRVVKVGKDVTRFKVGDYAGVGCMVNACLSCDYCEMDKEQFCENGTVFTYASRDHYHGNEITHGGYSDNIVVHEHFAVQVPKNADLKRVAPLLCAGVTTWSPIHFSKVQKGEKVGVAGFGGLGHMALQYLVDLGADVTVFDLSEDKREDAYKMGAKNYVNVNNKAEWRDLNNSFDFIISTIPNDYDATMYVNMLKYGKGELAIVGLPNNPNINILSLALQAPNRKVYGSLIGGMKETQEMLDYSIQHNLYPIVEVIDADPKVLDQAYENIEAGKVKFRYVIDMKTLK